MDVYILSIVDVDKELVDIDHEVFTDAGLARERLEELARYPNDDGPLEYDVWDSLVMNWEPEGDEALVLAEPSGLVRFQLRRVKLHAFPVEKLQAFRDAMHQTVQILDKAMKE